MAEIYTFSPYGYEGNLVRVETDIRRGIPAVDIVGLADGCVKECRERTRSAIHNSGFEFPMERVLISLSPYDLKKEGTSMDLAVALSVLGAKSVDSYMKDKIIVLGELELSGKVRSVRAVHAALTTASYAGIRYAVVPKENLPEAMAIEGIKVTGVESLIEAEKALCDETRFQDSIYIEENDDSGIKFSSDNASAEKDMHLVLPKKLIRAIGIAVAGKHHLMVVGKPGCGKTIAIHNLVPQIMPKLTVSESQSVTRIWSIAGLLSPKDSLVCTPPFRMPHQTCSLEGMCGGGLNCRPGEISLAHNGVLFLDETAEFKTSVLQMLRVPLETGTVTLSRAGRCTTYPANFQLMMAMNPCPCGNYGSKERICLCSEKSIEQYWNKISSPLIDRIGIIYPISEEDEKETVNISELRNQIRAAFRIQRNYGVYNNQLSPHGLFERFSADKESESVINSFIENNTVSERRAANIRKVALTIANMEGREIVNAEDICEAISYSKSFIQKLQED